MSQHGGNLEGDRFVVRKRLPDPEWDDYWNRIYVDEQSKRKLINFGLLEKQFGDQDFDRATLSHHGAILLAGPPGTGKTSLAKGAANELAKQLEDVVFKEMNVQHLFSSGFGDTPQLVEEAFQTVIEPAKVGETFQILLLDEVESLFSNRDVLTGDNDPYDAVRAVNEALRHLDHIAELSGIYIIATTNQPTGIDRAFYDRTDEQIFVGNPSADHRSLIFAEVFQAFNDAFGSELPVNRDEMTEVVEASGGFSGRRIRKTVLSALTREVETIDDPQTLSYGQVLTEFQEKQELLRSGKRDYIELGVDPEAELEYDEEQVTADKDQSAKDTVDETFDERGNSDVGSEPQENSETSVENSSGENDAGQISSGKGDGPLEVNEGAEPPAPVRSEESTDNTDTGFDERGSDTDPTTSESASGPKDRVTTLEPRCVVYNPTNKEPAIALRNRIVEFATATLGHVNPNLESVLKADQLEDVWYRICMTKDLERIELSVGDIIVPINVSYDQRSSESIRVPSPDTFSTDMDEQISITLIVPDEIAEKYDINSNREKIDIGLEGGSDNGDQK